MPNAWNSVLWHSARGFVAQRERVQGMSARSDCVQAWATMLAWTRQLRSYMPGRVFTSLSSPIHTSPIHTSPIRTPQQVHDSQPPGPANPKPHP
eukprot:356668-Chlamydomonas_euryale.AAC.5